MKLRPDGRKAPGPTQLEGIIRRNLRNASMTGSGPAATVHNATDGLESVKKTHQVAPVGTGAIPGRRLPVRAAIFGGPRGQPGLAGTAPVPFSTATRRLKPDQDSPLTLAQGMKRLGVPVAALLGVALIGLVTTSWLLNRDALREAVEA